MKKIVLTTMLAASLGIITQAQAQTPVPPGVVPPTPAQMQAIMAQQMQVMTTLYDLRKSRMGFAETVTAIKTASEKRGWKPGEWQDMQAAMRNSGVQDAPPMKVMLGCPPGANDKVARASGGKAPPLACRVTLFQGRDGMTYVVRMNTAVLSKGTQGELSKALAEVAAEEEAMLKGIVE